MSFFVILDTLKLKICLGDASECVEARGGTTNVYLIGRFYWYFDRRRGKKMTMPEIAEWVGDTVGLVWCLVGVRVWVVPYNIWKSVTRDLVVNVTQLPSHHSS